MRRYFVHFEVPLWLHRYLREVAFRHGTSISRIVQRSLFLWLWFYGELPEGKEVPDYAIGDIKKLASIIQLYEITQELKGSTRELREIASLLKVSSLELKTISSQLTLASAQPTIKNETNSPLPDFVIDNPWVSALANRSELIPHT